ncbi:sensor histidine kinase [Thalassospira sp. HF15]|uniref:sensor histidine kinase n=1 Tax=Thalassospira sp. HF15 TaxID=2722755 RepID=UPI001431B20A|nr:sensor histidine kinase [Thalassospira sp. HF15]NIY77725.1 sensor histidine kinase [Thalassospira sp. HF15]
MSDLAHYLRISNLLAGNLDIHSALSSVKTEIDKIIEFDHLDVCLIDTDKRWATAYEVGVETAWSKMRSNVHKAPIRDILLGKTDHLLTGNALQDQRFLFPGAVSAPIIDHELRSRVSVGMKVLGEVVGSLNCSSKKEDFYNQSHLEQMRILADMLAPYFYALRANEKANKEAIIRAEILAREEGLRLGALSLTDALEAERQRIGMDLHDQTLADLTRIARDLRPGLSEAQYLRLQQQVQNMIQGLRDIIDTSIPSILDLFGFHHAVQTHLERAVSYDSAMQFKVDDETDGAIDLLPETTRIAVFRICQEAINNAVLHSNASLVSVLITKSPDDCLIIKVSDNGNFQTNPRKPPSGLEHMKTRARLIGAKYDLSTTDGTQVTIQLHQATRQEGETMNENIAG